MRKLLTSLIVNMLLFASSTTYGQRNSNLAESVAQEETAAIQKAETDNKQQAVGMNPYTKDTIDAVSKIAAVLSFLVAFFVALHQVNKARREKQAQLQKDQEQREMELEAIRLNTKTNQALFWLELRKMFAEHYEVHINLRPNGAWHRSNTDPILQEMPKVEAYMGLFEHCKGMLDDGLIDWSTFKNIYAYRIDNILANPVIVREKLIKYKGGWKIFIELVESLGRAIPTDSV